MNPRSRRRRLVVVLLLVCAPAYTAALAGRAKDPVVAAFEQRLDDFLKLRAEAEKAGPAIEKKSSPQEIVAHRQQLAEELRKRRAGARVGDIFGLELSERIGRVMHSYLKRQSSTQRRAVEDDKPKQADKKIAVNGPYPDESRAMMPPDILAALPPLPEGLEYRFVEKHLLLIDTKSQLVIDLVPSVLS